MKKIFSIFTVLIVIVVFVLTGCRDDTSSIMENNVITEKAINVETILRGAVEQFLLQDHTSLKEPIEYKMLWLGYTDVRCEELNFTMNEDDKQYLRDVVYNFEQVVEHYSQSNLDINIDLQFVDKARKLTYDPSDNTMFLNYEGGVEADVAEYSEDISYNSVMTVVQSAGDGNYDRNYDK